MTNWCVVETWVDQPGVHAFVVSRHETEADAFAAIESPTQKVVLLEEWQEILVDAESWVSWEDIYEIVREDPIPPDDEDCFHYFD